MMEVKFLGCGGGVVVVGSFGGLVGGGFSG